MSFKDDGETFRDGELQWQDYNAANLSNLPEEKGTYLLGYRNGARVIYVGKATSVKARLATYGQSSCHNKWIELVAKERKVVQGFAPRGLQFMYRLTQHPEKAEAVAMQTYRTAIEGFNQRNEWAPLGDVEDQSYRLIVAKLMQNMPADQRTSFERWLAINR